MAAPGLDGDDVDHYEVLCLPSGEEGAALSVEQIEKAYKTQSRLRHPDKRPDDPNATADFQGLASSYKFLRDDSLRRQFDARLRGRREAAARAAVTEVKRRKAVSDLEARERAFAAGGGQYVDPDELARREDKRAADNIKRELNEFAARKNSYIPGSASTSKRARAVGARRKKQARMDVRKDHMPLPMCQSKRRAARVPPRLRAILAVRRPRHTCRHAARTVPAITRVRNPSACVCSVRAFLSLLFRQLGGGAGAIRGMLRVDPGGDEMMMMMMGIIKEEDGEDSEEDEEDEFLLDAAAEPGPERVRGRGRRGREEKERTKVRERRRRAVTGPILAGLRRHGNYSLRVRADINEVVAALAREAGWVVLPDGTTFPSSSCSQS